MRMFLAIELSDEVRAHLVGVQEALARELHGVAMTKGENLHVTLKFLGEVDERRVVELCESFAKVTSSEVELAAEKVECFPERGPVRIVAAAMAGEIETLAGLHAGIEQRCKFLGFEKENRKYRPHVTLARARGAVSDGARTKAQEVTAKLWPGPLFIMREFVLMESRLKPAGSEYVVAARFPVAGEKKC